MGKLQRKEKKGGKKKKMTNEQKKSIDKMDYESMLSLWRFAPSGHLMFQGDVGDYYSKIMIEGEKSNYLGKQQ